MRNRRQTKSKPTFIAYQVRDGKNKKGYFTRIGAAWPHEDGNGFNVLLDAYPLDGRITLRVPLEKTESGETGESAESAESGEFSDPEAAE